MSDRHVDYASAYFPFREPTKIVGEPSYRTLTQLRKELHANASSVDSELGGGNHGYLGLATHDANYPGTTAFVAPNYPPELIIPNTASDMQAMNLREQHKEKIRKHRECSNVEKSLQRHIQKAVDQKYIDHFVDDEIDLLVGDIPDILDDLFDNYGQIRGEDIKNKEAEMLRTSFAASDPLPIIWNPIERLCKFAQKAQNPYSDVQKIDFGLQLIRNTRDFEQALDRWEEKTDANKT